VGGQLLLLDECNKIRLRFWGQYIKEYKQSRTGLHSVTWQNISSKLSDYIV